MLKVATQRRVGLPRRPATATITFALFAPNNREATLRGDFSSWKDIPMVKGPDGNFRAAVPLSDGTWHYVFRVRSRSWFFKPDQWVEVVDPQATEVDPSGKHGVLHVAGGRVVVDNYVWKHDHVPLPPNEELVIYELHIGDFTPDGKRLGSFPDLVARLDYLVELGVNALELMPIKENPGRYSWGYNPRHFRAVDTNYGTTADFKRLVDECHGRGLRVFVDSVYNHAETGTPLAHIDHDYWFRHSPFDPENNWGPEFNYEQYDERLQVWPARQYVRDTLAYWVREFHLDGIRYDAARQMNSFDAMRDLVATAHQAAGPKPFYNVAEYIPQDPAVTNLDGPMDGAWHENFYYCMIDHLCRNVFDVERLKAAVDGRREGFGSALNMVNYLSNHDHNRLLAELGDNGWFDDVAFAKARQGAAICLTALGVPLLWMGEEFGESSYRTESAAPLDWSLPQFERNSGLYEYYQKLIALRQTHPALRTDNLDFFFEHVDQRLLAYVRWAGEAGVIVLANFATSDTVADIPNWPAGQWVSIDGDLTVVGPNVSLPLKACATLVLTRESPPPQG